MDALFDVPTARGTDPDTSHDAAASVDDLRTRQHAVLRVLSSYGALTDEELVAVYDYHSPPLPTQSPSGIRTRRHELVARRMVAFTGEKRQLDSGRYGRVWEAVVTP